MRARELYKEKMRNAVIITEPPPEAKRSKGPRGRKREADLYSDDSASNSGGENNPSRSKKGGRKARKGG